MTIKFCPNCGERYSVDFGVTDFIHECSSGNNALDQEDIVIIGDWEDYSGSGTKPSQEVFMQGAENELQGTIADIEEDEDKEDHTRRGARASTHRQRQHLQYINLKDEGLN